MSKSKCLGFEVFNLMWVGRLGIEERGEGREGNIKGGV